MSVYESIIKGLNEAIEYEKGEGKARVVKCTVNPALTLMRKRLKMFVFLLV